MVDENRVSVTMALHNSAKGHASGAKTGQVRGLMRKLACSLFHLGPEVKIRARLVGARKPVGKISRCNISGIVSTTCLIGRK